MAKEFVIFGATGSQGGAIASAFLSDKNNEYTIKAITRNKKGSKAQALEAAGAKVVEADMSDLASLKEAVKGASVIFAVTDFIAAGSIETETQQGLNIQEAALATFDTLELFIWSTVPDPRAQKIPYQNVIHANSKIEIGKSLQASKLGGILTEVRVGAYYQNMVKAPQLYGVQKVPDGSWGLFFPVHADTRMPFTSIQDLGRLIRVIAAAPAKYHTKSISVVSQMITPIEMLKAWNKVVGLNATFVSLSTEEFKQRLQTLHGFPDVFAVALAENLSLLRDAPNAFVEGTNFALQDLVSNLTTWEEYVSKEDWASYFKSIDAAKLF